MVLIAKQLPEHATAWLLFGFWGFILGWGLCYLVPASYLRDKRVLTAEQVRAECPQKAWVTEVSKLGPVVCAVLSFLFIFAQGVHIGQPSLVLPFFVPLAGMVGYNLYAAFLEIVAGISIILPFGRGRRMPICYVLSSNVHAVGVYRVVLAVIVFAAFYILVRCEKRGWVL